MFPSESSKRMTKHSGPDPLKVISQAQPPVQISPPRPGAREDALNGRSPAHFQTPIMDLQRSYRSRRRDKRRGREAWRRCSGLPAIFNAADPGRVEIPGLYPVVVQDTVPALYPVSRIRATTELRPEDAKADEDARRGGRAHDKGDLSRCGHGADHCRGSRR
jgi:hypothetical protein